MTQSANAPREEDVIVLSDGLVGLPDLKRWMLADMDPPMPMKWLVSRDRPGFRLPVADPCYFDPEYAFELDDRADAFLGHPAASDLAVMIVSTVHAGGERITGNLAAPIVVNINGRNGLQCILDERNYCLHQEIDYVRFGADVTVCEAVPGDADAESGAETPERDAVHGRADADSEACLVKT